MGKLAPKYLLFWALCPNWFVRVRDVKNGRYSKGRIKEKDSFVSSTDLYWGKKYGDYRIFWLIREVKVMNGITVRLSPYELAKLYCKYYVKYVKWRLVIL